MSRSVTEVFVGLLIVAIPLIGLARRWLIPYPIALVLGGLALGFVPGLPAISLDPDLVLLAHAAAENPCNPSDRVNSPRHGNPI